MFIYELTVQRRFVILGKGGITGKRAWIVVDGIGLHASYREEDELDPKNVRCYLIGEKTEHILIEAPSPERAIERFHVEWQGAQVGDRGPKSKGLRISKEAPIKEFPPCSFIHKNRHQDYICGPVEPDGLNGEHGGCVLDRFDAPDFFCPINEFWRRNWNKRALKTTVVKGYKVVRGSLMETSLKPGDSKPAFQDMIPGARG